MKTTLLYPILLLLIAGFTSCQQRMYFPDRANTPGLTEAYETKLTLALKPQSANDIDSVQKGNPVSFSADFAFAPANHFAIFGSYRSINHRIIKEKGNGGTNVFGGDFWGHRWEGGLGFFNTFDRLGKYEVYVGYGSGNIKRYSNYSPQKDYSARYSRIFVQPAIGVGNQKYSITGGFRLTYQKFYDFESRDPDLQYTIMRYIERSDVEKETMGFIEPFINAEVGGKYLKYNMQVGCSGQIMGGNVVGTLPAYVSMGLVLHIAPSFISGEDRSKKKAAE